MGMAIHAGHDHDEHHSHDENPAPTGH